MTRGGPKNNGEARLASIPKAGAAPEPPEDLRATGAAIWAMVWSLPQSTPADATTIERLCRLEDEAASLRAVIQEQGETLKRPMQNSRGQVIGEEYYSHPGIANLRKIGAEAARLCDALGLSPHGRQRLGLAVAEVDDGPDWLDELRAKRTRRRGAIGEDRV